MVAGLDTPLRGYSTSMTRRSRVLSLTTETQSGFAARYDAFGTSTISMQGGRPLFRHTTRGSRRAFRRAVQGGCPPFRRSMLIE
ncbi:hypothetical protein EDF54_0058 [Rathayibacter sp. PhB93]|nr:hypothetical protein EDF54_0058 [Rathayibacter sp. PhB93]TDQ13897.1 hypothetical protein EDF17_0912 [Rathayibacter sp. PhB1]